jgi:hypothetical protein
MLFRQQTWPGIADGSVTMAFRRWKRPSVRVGGTLRTGGGMIAIDTIDVIDEAGAGAISDADAHAAGFASVMELLRELDARAELPLYRVAFHLAGPDPRDALRERAAFDADERATLGARLARLDAASKSGPWTASVLALIAERPGVRAGDLAASLGRETLPFKLDVRKLKALGLTESLEVGYRLSPRGRAYLAG